MSEDCLRNAGFQLKQRICSSTLLMPGCQLSIHETQELANYIRLFLKWGELGRKTEVQHGGIPNPELSANQ